MSARYVRVFVTKSRQYTDGNYWVQLAEVEVSEAVSAPGEAKLSWTSTGDDGTTGTATSYDVRYSTTALNEGNFASATTAVGEPAPQVSGSVESMTVSGLSPGTLYYFGMKVTDDSGNVSSLSNIAQLTTPTGDVTAPSAVTDLSAQLDYTFQVVSAAAIASSGDINATYSKEKATDGIATTAWSTPTRATIETEYLTVDLGVAREVGRVRLQSRDVLGALFPVDFELQVSADGVNFASVHGESDFIATANTWYTFDGFTPATGRYVRLWVTETAFYSGGYWVQLGEIEVSEAVPTTGQTRLQWTAPGDDGTTGTATSYEIRYSTSPIVTEGDFTSATLVSSPPSPSSAGAQGSHVVTGLSLGTYHFALKASDEVGNASPISNGASVTVQ